MTITMENEINKAHEAVENDSAEISKTKRWIVVPGETVIEGEDYLPGEGTRREGNKIIASKFGLAEEAGRVIKIISIFGAFIPRRGNVVIGRVTDLTHSGWLIDIDASQSAFLPIAEFPRYVNKSEMDQHLAIGDMVSVKIWSIQSRGIDLAMKGRGLGKLEGGFAFRVIPSRVPRVIGREGSMVSLIKERTGCTITVGQNGWIWIKGPSTDSEIKARKVIDMVAGKVHVSGLTEKVEGWFEENEK